MNNKHIRAIYESPTIDLQGVTLEAGIAISGINPADWIYGETWEQDEVLE